MRYALYNGMLRVAAPLLRAKLRATPRHRPLIARFAPPIPACGSAPLWIHACSVGEVNAVRPLITAMRQTFPDLPLFLTASTITGYQHAQRVGECAVTWCPFDTPAVVRAFLQALRPRALLLVETEVWPNLLRECDKRDIPTVVINGRLSDKHYKRYSRWMRPCFKYLRAAAMQDAEHADRMCRLGLPPTQVRACGNLKYDSLSVSVASNARSALRHASGISAQAPLIVFGSTRSGDEVLAAACWAALHETFLGLRFVVAPRHIERAPQLPEYFQAACQFRSRPTPAADAPILILDTLGELVSFYALASVAVIGGSFLPGVEGHNPLEPAALGIPVIFGPHMANFREPAHILLQARAAIRCATVEELPGQLARLLADPAERRQMGTRGRRAVLAQQGATARTLEFLAEQDIIGPPTA